MRASFLSTLASNRKMFEAWGSTQGAFFLSWFPCRPNPHIGGNCPPKEKQNPRSEKETVAIPQKKKKKIMILS